MRVTVCELPHEPGALDAAWAALCEHTSRERSELVLLPEFAMVEPVWETEQVDPARWRAAEALGARWLARLKELRAEHVVSTRPVTIDGRRLNQGFMASGTGVVPLRSKYFLPDEPGGWEAHWFDRGDADFPSHRAGALSFGLNICTELWALESYAAYARAGVQAILAPRATAAATTAKWMAAGVVAAVRSGAYSVSSNRVDPTGACGGVGWIISPDGAILATTSRDMPFVTIDIDLAAPPAARVSYPRYVFADGNEALYGTWRLSSYSERVVATGETSAFYGKHPQGILTYGRDGRMFAIVSKDHRPHPANMAKATAEERAELFTTMAAYAGTFTFNGETAIHHVDISWNESWTGTDQIRHVRLDGGRLHITSDPFASDVDGRIIVAELIWEKI